MNLLNKLRPLVSSSGNSRALRCSNFCMNFDRNALAKISSPSATSSAIKSVNNSMTQVSSKSQSTRPSTTRTFFKETKNITSTFVMKTSLTNSEAPDQIYKKTHQKWKRTSCHPLILMMQSLSRFLIITCIHGMRWWNGFQEWFVFARWRKSSKPMN